MQKWKNKREVISSILPKFILILGFSIFALSFLGLRQGFGAVSKQSEIASQQKEKNKGTSKEKEQEIENLEDEITFIKEGNRMEIHASDKLKSMMPKEEKIGPIFSLLFLGILFSVISYTQIFRPEFIYEFWEKWKSSDSSECSDEYRRLKKIEGFINGILALILFGIFIYTCVY